MSLLQQCYALTCYTVICRYSWETGWVCSASPPCRASLPVSGCLNTSWTPSRSRRSAVVPAPRRRTSVCVLPERLSCVCVSCLPGCQRRMSWVRSQYRTAVCTITAARSWQLHVVLFTEDNENNNVRTKNKLDSEPSGNICEIGGCLSWGNWWCYYLIIPASVIISITQNTERWFLFNVYRCVRRRGRSVSSFDWIVAWQRVGSRS